MSSRSPGRRWTPWLGALLALFCARVLAQLVQLIWDIPFLPAFDAWHSGALPYPVLLASQLATIAACWTTLVRLRRDTLRAHPPWHVLVPTAGAIYLAVTTFRLVAGLTFLAHVPWFAAYLPTLFHFVLAAYVLTIGLALWRQQRMAARY